MSSTKKEEPEVETLLPELLEETLWGDRGWEKKQKKFSLRVCEEKDKQAHIIAAGS